VKLPFPEPSSFSLTKLANRLQIEYPTFVVSYMGCPLPDIPNPDKLGEINAIHINFEKMNGPDSPLEVVAYLTPKQDLLDFAHSHYYSVIADTGPCAKFLEEVASFQRFVLFINTEYFAYKALVDSESGEVIESDLDFRYLT
jgi:hypothetical protein